MTAFRSDFHRLSALGLSWGFRHSMVTNNGRTIICDLTDRSSHMVVVSAEGSDRSDALAKATELAQRMDQERRLAAAEGETLTAENDRLKNELAQSNGVPKCST